MKEWTIMVYMAGDNNLSENMAFTLDDIEKYSNDQPQTGKDRSVNLLAYFDNNSLTVPTHYIDYSDSEVHKHQVGENDQVHNNNERSTHETNEDSASPTSILNFFHWCVKTRKRRARNYAIIFSTHSFGFHGTSFLRDETSGTFMTLSEFRRSLEQVNDLYLEDGEKIAILGFDSCVMSMLEIGYELKDVARTIVASEGSLPNSGWGYAPMLKKFVSNVDSELGTGIQELNTTDNYVNKVATGFVEAFIEQHKNLSIGGNSVDIASWDLAKVAPVAEGINDLAIELNKYLKTDLGLVNGNFTSRNTKIYSDLKKILLQTHYDCQTYMKEQCVDLKDFCERLVIECASMENDENSAVYRLITAKCENIISAIDDCVLKAGFSGDNYQFSNGISLFFPWTLLAYSITRNRYEDLYFNRGISDAQHPMGVGKDWNEFVKNYVSSVTLRPARKQKVGTVSNVSDISLAAIGSHATFPITNGDVPTLTKMLPPHSKGGTNDYLTHFAKFKNFQLAWDTYGFSNDSISS